MHENLRLITLAGLFHDIGKICYRANEYNGNHSKRGNAFFEEIANEIKDWDNQILKDCVLYHHKSALKNARLAKNNLAYIVYEADNIAAGVDRRSEESEGDNEINSQQKWDKNLLLANVFNIVNGKTLKEEQTFFALQGLLQNGIQKFFPFSKGDFKEDVSGKYTGLLNDLKINIKRLNLETSSIEEALEIMEAVTSFMPSSTDTEEYSDISLFDHSRITAAIASSLWQYFQSKNIDDYKKYCFDEEDNKKFRKNERPITLIAGDLSGIQDFIYNVASKGALKSLRGRSFYLEMFIEHIVDEILEKLQISRANLIYSGGGHFYILAANTEKTHLIIEESISKINNWLLKNVGTILSMQIACVDCTVNELMNPKLDENGNVIDYYKNKEKWEKTKRGNLTGQIFAKLSQELSKKKKQKYTSEQLKALFLPTSEYNNVKESTKECIACKISTEKLLPYEEKAEGMEEDSLFICPLCYALFCLGDNLNKIYAEEKEMLMLTFTEEKEYTVELPSLFSEQCFLKVMSRDAYSQEKKKNEEKIKRLYVKNKIRTGEDLATHLWIADYAYRYTEGERKGELWDFKEFSESSQGISRLGVLRADVDFLGATFVAGFNHGKESKENYATISRYATLSRQLSLFFKYYINEIGKGSFEKYKKEKEEKGVIDEIFSASEGSKKINIVYAGGDDMFVVGAWNDLLYFTIQLERAFNLFTNGKLTFSAGIALFEEKFPIMAMAKSTGTLEDKAKAETEKNSIALFGVAKDIFDVNEYFDEHVYNWQIFREKICEEKLNFLLENVTILERQGKVKKNQGENSKFFVGMTWLYKTLKLLKSDHSNNNKINIARFAYHLARVEEQIAKDDQTLKEKYETFKKKMWAWCSDGDGKERRELDTAIRLFVYLNRKKQSEV